MITESRSSIGRRSRRRGRSDAVPCPRRTPIEVADSIIDQLITVGYTLASCVDVTEYAAVRRMGLAVAELDRAIHQLDASPGAPR